MAKYETFSKRQKKLQEAGQQDVYQYDVLPTTFRVQVIHIWNESLGNCNEFSIGKISSYLMWRRIHDILAREAGLFHLGTVPDMPSHQCKEYVLAADTGNVLDIIEISFRMIDRIARQLSFSEKEAYGITQDADDAIDELNERFREHNIGYQYVGGELVRVDSQYLHAEAVKPAIGLLQEEDFSGASEEFLEAHEHYRKGDYKDAIAWALKAFESTMKTICEKRNWPYDKTANAKALIDIMLSKGLIPSELTSHFTALRTVLEAGLPTLRNRTSGHGQGANPVKIPDYFAGYALHLAASNIVFLMEAHKALK